MTTTGLEGVVVAETRLSRVSGEEGRLRYAGYAIEDLAGNASFEDVCHLLWTGDLPEPRDLAALRSAFTEAAGLPRGVVDVIRSGAKRAHPMSTLQAAIAASAFFDPDAGDESRAANWRRSVRLAAVAVSVTAAIGRLRAGRVPVPPRGDLGLAANLFYMLRGRPADEVHVQALDTAFILHAEHGMNPSTLAVRIAASTRSDIHSAVAAAIGTLKGAVHGGAPEGVMRMLEAIERPERAREWVQSALSRGERIMGFGHRAYRTVDPRVPILRAWAVRLGAADGGPHGDSSDGSGMPWLAIADELQRVMEEEMQRRGKAVYPNVDLLSTTVYASLGIPAELFGNLFACARMAGWTAHFMEQLETNRPIWPDAAYVGPADRKPPTRV